MSARTPPAAVSGALAGGAFGLCFATAEVFAAYLTGGRFPFFFFAFLSAYYLPAFAALGVGLGLRSLLLALVFSQTAFVLSQEFFRRDPLLRGNRPLLVACALASTAAAAFLLDRASRRCGSSGVRATDLLMPAVLALLTAVELAWFAALPPRLGAAAFLALLVPGLAGSRIVVSAAVGRLRERLPRAVALLGLAGVFAYVCSAALGAASSASPYFRDLPQPDFPVAARAGTARPNVVLVVLDTVRAASVSCYGYGRPTTPRLDAFAGEAVRYARCLSVAPWSLPSHASLFTGLLPSRHLADGPALAETDPPTSGAHPLADRFDTVAEILTTHGYATAAVSANVGALFGRYWNVDQGFRFHDARPSRDSLTFAYEPLLHRVTQHVPRRLLLDPMDDVFLYHPTAEEITDRAQEWLRRRRSPGRPYLLFVHYMDAHEPYARGKRRAWPGRSPAQPDHGLAKDDEAEILSGRRAATPEESEHLRALYDGAISYLDEELGRLLDFLKTQPDDGDTWIVITADHGQALGEHKSLGHRATLYQEILWVPLIIRYPPRSAHAAGAVDDRPVQQIDVLPTLLDALGVPLPEDLDGRSIREGRETMIAEARLDPYLASLYPDTYRREIRALIRGELKYVETTNAPAQLFDLARDAGETRNLAEVLPDRAAELRAQLERWKAAVSREAPPERPEQEVPEEFLEHMRALRYIR